jgi:hypothetical protein
MTPLAIAHKALKGDLSNAFGGLCKGDLYLFRALDNSHYITDDDIGCNGIYEYISTVEEFNNFKGDDVKTVYTQEMADNGVLPSVGMECLAVYVGVIGGSEDKVTIAHINNKGQFACIDDNGDYLIQYVAEDDTESFKPLTPPVELIDGKAYQFESRGNVFHGIYEKKYTSFNVMAGQLFNDISCTNIQPLTVEDK